MNTDVRMPIGTPKMIAPADPELLAVRTPDLARKEFDKSDLSHCRDAVGKQEHADERHRQDGRARSHEKYPLHEFLSPCF